MQNTYSDDRLRLAARLYYVDGLGQNEVAKFVKVSQAKVSRLLAMARARGIVRITVADYESRNREIEVKLRVQLSLTDAIVVRAIEGLGPADLRHTVGYFAAPGVAPLIQANDVVALAGGRTIHELVRHLPEAQHPALTAVQAMGSVDSVVNAFDAQEVSRQLAQRLGGSFLALSTPAFMPDTQTRDTLLALPQIGSVHSCFARASVALVGVGTLENSVFIERGVFTPADIEQLRAAGAIGEICGRFYDAEGRECVSPWRDRSTGINLEQLRRIPQVIAVVSGSDRTAALLAAIRGRLIKSLVIDDAGAQALLATTTPPASSAPTT